MDPQTNPEVKQIAAQILAGMLSNPHIYPTVSDDGASGQQEQTLIAIAIELAEALVQKAERSDTPEP